MADHPAIYASSYEDALHLSKEINLPVLLIFSSDNCHHCDRLKQNITDIKDVIIYIAKIKKDKELYAQYNVSIVPDSVLIINNTQHKRLKGFKDKDSYLLWLTK
jgi:thioredoxin-related protein